MPAYLLLVRNIGTVEEHLSLALLAAGGPVPVYHRLHVLWLPRHRTCQLVVPTEHHTSIEASSKIGVLKGLSMMRVTCASSTANTHICYK